MSTEFLDLALRGLSVAYAQKTLIILSHLRTTGEMGSYEPSLRTSEVPLPKGQGRKA